MSDVEDLAEIIRQRSCCRICPGGQKDIARAILASNYVIPKRVVDPEVAGDAS